MRYAGKITDWDDDRGFGFVSPNGGGERAFVHVNAFEQRLRRPHQGMLISYETSQDSKRRVSAIAIRQISHRDRRLRSQRIEFPRKTVSSAFLAIIAFAGAAKSLPLIVPFAYGIMSTLTFMAYDMDKSAAINGGWRTQERSLHFMSLACGWPGALFAQSLLRHKSRKSAFQATFWISVVTNLAALAWLVASGLITRIQLPNIAG